MKETYVSAVIDVVSVVITDVISTSTVPQNFGDGNDHNSGGWNT